MGAGRSGPRGDEVDSIKATIARTEYDAVIFDLDGVVTQTAAVHAAAWKRLFDAYLAERAARGARPGRRDPVRRATVGRRAAAIRPRGRLPPVRGRQAALRRRARLPRLARHRAAHGRSVRPTRARDGLRARQPQERLLQRRGAGARRQDLPLHRRAHPPAARTPGSGSASCRRARTPPWCWTYRHRPTSSRCGSTAWWRRRSGLPGKPDPAMYLETARRLGVDAARSVVVEDALSGVEAGRRGGFGLVIGVDRLGRRRSSRRPAPTSSWTTSPR